MDVFGNHADYVKCVKILREAGYDDEEIARILAKRQTCTLPDWKEPGEQRTTTIRYIRQVSEAKTDEVDEIIACVECGMSLDCAMQRLDM